MERTFMARTELEAVSDAAPNDRVLAIAEDTAIRSGRELTLAVTCPRESGPSHLRIRIR